MVISMASEIALALVSRGAGGNLTAPGETPMSIVTTSEVTVSAERYEVTDADFAENRIRCGRRLLAASSST